MTPMELQDGDVMPDSSSNRLLERVLAEIADLRRDMNVLSTTVQSLAARYDADEQHRQVSLDFKDRFGSPSNLASELGKIVAHNEKFTAKFGAPEALSARIVALEQRDIEHTRSIADMARTSDVRWAKVMAVGSTIMSGASFIAVMYKLTTMVAAGG